MVFLWELSDSKSSQVSSILLGILTVLNNAVWMVSIRPLISKSSSPCTNTWVTVPKAPVMIGITVTFMFHNFFDSLARSRHLSFFSLSFSFILWSAGAAKSTILQVLFFLLIIIRSGLLAETRRSVCMSKSHRSLRVPFSMTCWLEHIPFVRIVKFKFLAHLPVDHLAHPIVSCFRILLC